MLMELVSVPYLLSRLNKFYLMMHPEINRDDTMVLNTISLTIFLNFNFTIYRYEWCTQSLCPHKGKTCPYQKRG
jgi:hypothetical protein